MEDEIQLRDHVLSDPEKGWVDFWSRYQGFVKSLIRKYHLSIEDSGEVFQEISLKLAKDRGRILQVWDPKRCSLKGFLAVLVTSSCLNFLKSSFHRYQTLKSEIEAPAFLVEDPAPTPLERLERLERARAVRESLNQAVVMGALQREDLLLLELRLGGMSYREISRLMGVPPETLGTRFHRLKGKLKKHLRLSGFDASTFSS